jgi:predicted kinase
MSDAISVEEAVAALAPEPGLVVLMCGLAGSGKTTVSKQVEARGFLRLSFDEQLWESCGRFGIDYPAEAYPRMQDVARAILMDRFLEALAERTPTVIDSAFWNRAARDGHKALVEDHGGSWRLLYLKADPGLLRRRLSIRAERFDANAAFPITDDVLDRFLRSFEPPDGEGEIVVAA